MRDGREERGEGYRRWMEERREVREQTWDGREEGEVRVETRDGGEEGGKGTDHGWKR